MTDPTRAHRARIRRRFAAPLLAALLAVGTLTPAFADNGPVDPANPADPGAAAPPTPTGPVQTAQLQAVATGQPVTIDSLTTATSTVLANPDGSLTQTTNALPVRVQQSGAWVPLDDTLTTNPDGTVTTKATTTAVTLSGGGTSPLVTFTNQAGQQLSLSMPFALPIPAISGNTALYASALPGVDLSVSVDPQGNFRDVLIVHNATAAANPALKTLQLAATTQGLTLATATGGGMDANAPDGTTVFTSPIPTMWDSSNNATAGGGAPSPSAGVTLAASAQSEVRTAARAADAPADTSTVGASGLDTVSGTDGPGTGAQVAQVPMTTSSSALTLTPDQSLLTGTGTAYPVYIDPPVDNLTSNYFEAQEGCDSASSSGQEYDYAQMNGEGVGYQAYDSANGDCIGAERSFFEIDTSKLTSNMDVLSSILDVNETYAARWGCSTTAPVTVKWTGAISRGMYWDTQPAALSTLGTITLGSAYNGSDSGDTTSCGVQDGSLVVTSAISSIAGKSSSWTFGLYNPDESSSSDFERFSTDPKLVTTYDIAPTIAASSVNTTPAAVTTNAQGQLVQVGPACGTGTPGWIGQTTTNNGASNITMNATAVSPVGSTVATWFNMTDTGDGTGTPAQVTYNHTSYQASGSPASLAMSTTVTDGHQYSWATQASDSILTSNTVSACRFNVDLTPPNQATVTSTDFPVAGSNTTKYFAGSTGVFTLTSTDPQPATCSIPKCLTSGLAGFRYSLDQPIPTKGYSYIPADSTGTAQLSITPEGWGTHILYVEAVDNAGNSAVNPATYTFYAPWNPNSHVIAGDLTGDHTPDLLATNSTGDLVMLPGDANPDGTNAHDTPCAPPVVGSTPSNYLPGCQASPAADSPDHTSWSDFQIAHRGSLHNMTVDDLFAHQKNNAILYSVDNDGIHDGGVNGRFTLVHTVIPKPQCLPVTGRSNNCALYDATDWSTVDQMTAPGSVYGDGYADLITSEKGSSGDQLWLYRGSSGASLGPATDGTTATTPVLLGTGDWSHFTLISPGTIGGDVNASTPGTETLWARDNNSGILYSFSLAIDPTTGYPDEIAAPTTAPFTSAVTTPTGGSLCAADASGSTAPGSPAITWTCDKAPEQAFSLLADHTVRTEGLCLQASAATNGSSVTFNTCNSGSTLQQWTAGTTGSLVNTASGMCLADPAANQTRDTALMIWTCDNGAEQNWAAQSGNQLPAPMPTMPIALAPVLTTAAYPTLASPGDSSGLGEPSLYAVTPTPTNEVVDYPGVLPSSSGAANFAAPADEGIFSNSANWWNLNGATDSTGAAIDTESSTGTTDAALQGSANWATDSSRVTSSNPTGTVLNLDGTTGYASTSGSVVNTAGSYTVSAWAKLNSGFNPASHYTVVAQRDGTGLRCGFYLQYSDSFKGWTLVSPGTDTASPSAYYHAGDSITATAGQWTHLVGVFDASTDTMSLYVNGQLAGTGTNPTPWNSSTPGPLLIGGSDNNSNGSQADFPGEISDVHVYDIALSPSAATTLNDTPAPINNLN